MAVGSRFFLRDFDGGQMLSDRQEFRLGQIGQDEIGQEWSYVRFNPSDTFSVGQWVADNLTESANVSYYNDGTPTLLYVGNDRFETREESVGAVGIVHSGDGAGQGFVVTDWLGRGSGAQSNFNHVKIRLLHSATELYTKPDDEDGWGFREALSESTGGGKTVSNVRWLLSGNVVTPAAVGNPVRGVLQRGIEASDYPIVNGTAQALFGWVLQKGVGVVRKTATAIAIGVAINAAANGNVVAGGSGEEIGRTVTPGGAAGLILAELHIENNAQARGGPRPLTGVGMRGQVIR